MQHEFKFAGEMIEVTIARDSENWMLGENRAQVLADGRILVTVLMARQNLLIQPRLVMCGGFILMDRFSVLRNPKQAPAIVTQMEV